MDTHSIDPSGRRPQQPSSLAAVSGAQVDAEAVDTTSNSELGRVAQDVGATIDKWNDLLNQALKDWLDDANDIEELMKVVADAVPFLADLKKDVYSDPLNSIALGQIIMEKMIGGDIAIKLDLGGLLC